jgi:hypothetical protein
MNRLQAKEEVMHFRVTFLTALLSLGLAAFASVPAWAEEEEEKDSVFDVQDKLVAKHKVKSITRREHAVKAGKLEQEGTTQSIQEFDAKGNKTKETWYEPDGDVDYTQTFKYDDAGNSLEQAFASDTMNTLAKHTYDGEGKETASESHSDGKLDMKFLYEYDDKGRKVLMTRHDAAGNLDAKFVYKYDDHGNLEKEIQYDAGGNVTEKISTRYIAAGKVKETTILGGDGKPRSQSKYMYNAQGDVTRHWGFNHHGSFDTYYHYKYDKQGRKVYEDEVVKRKILFWTFNTVVRKSTYKYDDKGVLRVWISFKSEHETDAIFHFDYRGLIKKVVRYRDGAPEAAILYTYAFHD